MHKQTAPANGREMAKLLTQHGFIVVKTKKGHYRASHQGHSDKPPVHFASSPSDYRWARNTLSWIKRTYQIDLTKP